jgi:RNA polymerase sigma-70 factor (ECF subfamily)
MTTSTSIKTEQNAEQIIEKLLSFKPVLVNKLMQMVEAARAEDIAQEAYLALYLKLQNDRLESPIAYLVTSAKRMAISALRHDKVCQAYYETHKQSESYRTLSIEKGAMGAQTSELLIQAINRLPPICRQVFIMRKIEEKSHSEIADLMCISKKTVENHLAKGLQLCRKYMVESSTKTTRRQVG